MSKAAELRAEAERLERAEAEAAVEARCMSHGIEWDRRGRAVETFGEFVKCRSPRHHKAYTDEYGTTQYCPDCRGNDPFVRHYIRRPQYDAPQPPREKLAR